MLDHRFVSLAGTGLAALLMWAAWVPEQDAASEAPSASTARTPSRSSDDGAGSVSGPRWLTMPATATTAPSTAQRQSTQHAVVPITVVASRSLQVGDFGDLVIGLGSTAGVHEVGFVVQFDPELLQIRAGIEGDWAVGAGRDARFAAEISAGEDRVQVRSSVSSEGGGPKSGSVAILQFQAVAPGIASVLISDVVVKDAAGGTVPSAVFAPILQVTVESTLQQAPRPVSRPEGDAAAESVTEESVSGGD